MKLPVPLRLLKERYFGEASRNQWVAKNRLAALVTSLDPDVAAIVTGAVASLIEYQDPDYALLYLDRIARYSGPNGFDTQMLSADPFVAMAAAAMKTSRIKLGTGVLIPSNRIAPVAATAFR